ncbi:hypothetical protein [Halorhabdus amylolytica]|uniref:hypothetical protein n=1 Tax=Halorhabdus amylolytica TaxID=2559573 RepID=UPI0010AA9960|nr:hypothetical protein [Halorhabdus amylolytica]
MTDRIIDVTRWEESNGPDYDEEDVDHIVADEDVDEVVYGGSLDGEELVRVLTTVEEDGREVDYTVDLSESVIREAANRLDDIDE